ncbi:hypothetical protein [Microvirga lotononidis]|uniref:hypothetical protein n=1 Tax=Microvirga lotononidis TaxID=864069 RepID=UPI0002D29C4F|nr:hypothetical protein [Microvirga lotononidis]
MRRAAHVHSGVVKDEIADVDEMAIEHEGSDRFGHIAPGLPPRRKAGSLQPSIEAENGNRELLQTTRNCLPR